MSRLHSPGCQTFALGLLAGLTAGLLTGLAIGVLLPRGAASGGSPHDSVAFERAFLGATMDEAKARLGPPAVIENTYRGDTIWAYDSLPVTKAGKKVRVLLNFSRGRVDGVYFPPQP